MIKSFNFKKNLKSNHLKMDKEVEKAREELINLYLNIKIRTQEEVKI